MRFLDDCVMEEGQDYKPPPFVLLNLSPPNEDKDVTLTNGDVGKDYRVRIGDKVHGLHIFPNMVGKTISSHFCSTEEGLGPKA